LTTRLSLEVGCSNLEENRAKEGQMRLFSFILGWALVCPIASTASADDLPPGIGRIVFHGNRVVRFAYVPERTSSGVPIHWPGSCVFVRPHSAGTTHIAGDTEQTVIADVLEHWQASTRSCGYLNLMLEPPEAGEVGLDYVNRIIFREDRWCQPATATRAEICHDPMVGAVTSLLYVDTPGAADDGTILDVDIEINAVDYSVGICDGLRCTTSGTQPIIQDLANQLTHELGHLLGLGHTCWTETTPPPTDTDGTPIPLCSDPDLSFDARTATMFPISVPEETRKASLAPRDIEDFCEIYPLADDPDSCTPSMPRDAGPPGRDAGPDAGTDASPPVGDAGTDLGRDGGVQDAATPDGSQDDLGTPLPDAEVEDASDPMVETDATLRRDGAIHTVPPMEEGCACAIGQGPPRTPGAVLILLGLSGAAALIRRRRRPTF
jgi:MYXO-CTERM domain-containing protein